MVELTGVYPRAGKQSTGLFAAVLRYCRPVRLLSSSRSSKTKSTRRGTAGAFILVELTGVEPVSEKKAVRVSPGAVHLLKFPQCERVHTLDTLVAS